MFTVSHNVPQNIKAGTPELLVRIMGLEFGTP